MSDNLADADAGGRPDSPAERGSVPGLDFDLAQITGSPLVAAMRIQFVQATAQLLIATMPVEGNTQPYGLLHGGASCVLAETLGSVGSAIHAAPLGKIAVGIDINATHHRAARSGLVTATARPLQLGSTLASYAIEIMDDAKRRICTARLTCMLLPAPGRIQ